MNLGYLGAIRAPHDVGFNYSNGPMTLDLPRREIVLFGKTRRVGRLALVRPQVPRYMATGDTKLLDRSSVPVAEFVPESVTADPTNDTWREIFPGDAGEGTPEGVQVLGDRALLSGSIYYDASHTQDRSLILTDWPITTQPVPGTPWRSVKDIPEGWAAGPITVIPEKWRAAFKGDVLVGQPGGLPIITRQSFGPCAIALRAADLLTTPDVDGTLLLGYREGQGWEWSGPPNDFWNSTTQYNAMTFIGDFLVFIGRHGYGVACYGKGTADPALHDTADPRDGGHFCFDPTNSYKGTHGYPYRVQGLGYACHELAAVAAGTMQPHEPTAFWFPIVFPFFEHQHSNYQLPPGAIPNVEVIGADYDPAAGELYVGVFGQDSYGYEPGPLVHVFSVDGIARTPLERPLFTSAPPDVIPDPTPELNEIRAEVLRLRGELEETRVQLDVVEAQRIQLATELQAEVAARATTTARLESVLVKVRAVTGGLEVLRTIDEVP